MTFFKDYQDLLGSIIGLFGIGLSIWLGFHSSTRQRQRELDHNRIAIASALGAELKSIKDSLAAYIDVISNTDNHASFSLARNPLEPEIYTKASVEIIGLLPSRAIDAVVEAYGDIRKASQAIHYEGTRQEKDPGIFRFIKGKPEEQKLLTSLERAKVIIEKAIDALRCVK